MRTLTATMVTIATITFTLFMYALATYVPPTVPPGAQAVSR
ncbi:MAG TPA: hypothetical protein VEY87_08490 [Gaiellaceae bacterium]|jgi:hypothetical protein|nr:hypothetical protein [Gaiellaceae bacterium]